MLKFEAFVRFFFVLKCALVLVFLHVFIITSFEFKIYPGKMSTSTVEIPNITYHMTTQ